MEEYVNIFQCLADDIRLRIFRLLIEEGELCVCEIEEALNLPQYAVSRALRILSDKGLVKKRKEGLWRLYSISHRKGKFTEELAEFVRKSVSPVKEDIKRLKSNPDLRTKRLLCKGVKRGKNFCKLNVNMRIQEYNL